MQNRPLIIGVMGGGKVAAAQAAMAYQLGRCIAREGWVLLNGGLAAGVMEASARGAREAGGITVGVLPGADTADASPHVLIPIITGMGSARNAINVLSSDVVIALPGGAGTLSEVALALKFGKPLVLLGFATTGLPAGLLRDGKRVRSAGTPEEAVALVHELAGTFPKDREVITLPPDSVADVSRDGR